MRKGNKQRHDGRYQSKVYLGDGRYKYVYADSQKELDDKVLQIKIALNKGIDVTADKDSFGKWADQWLAVKYHEVSYGRYISYKANIQHLEPLYTCPVTRLRPIDFTNLFYELKKKGLAAATIKACKSAGKQVYDLAISNRVTDYNPASLAKVPKETPGRATAKDDRRALTPREIKWITDTPHRAQTPAMIMLYAGLRRGEVIPLTWDHIDLENKTIFVECSVETTEEGLTVKEGGKTMCATRTVDIPNVLADYLRQTPHECEFVCPSAHKKMMSLTSWRKMWDSYLNVLNFRYGDIKDKPTSRFAPKKLPFVIPKITPHWLRHTFITMMYQAGVDVLTAKEQAGHADIQTTLSIYTHLDRTHKRRQMDKLDDYITSQASDNDSEND